MTKDRLFLYIIFIYTIYFSSSVTLREKCPYSEIFWSVFSRIQTEYGEILHIQSECGKIWSRKTPNKSTFYAVSVNGGIFRFLVIQIFLNQLLIWRIYMCYKMLWGFITCWGGTYVVSSQEYYKTSQKFQKIMLNFCFCFSLLLLFSSLFFMFTCIFNFFGRFKSVLS